MSKRELINAIIQHNRTAAPEFLARFAENELKAYLDRVSVVATARKTLRQVLDAQSGKSSLPA
jgi:hypothetical protein